MWSFENDMFNLLELCEEKIQEFEDIIKQYNIDIFDLYSEKNEYNEKIDNYLKNKVY